MADFYVISISQIGTNRWPIETKDMKIGSGHCEIVKKNDQIEAVHIDHNSTFFCN